MSASSRNDEQVTSSERSIANEYLQYLQREVQRRRKTVELIDKFDRLQALTKDYWDACVEYYYAALHFNAFLSEIPGIKNEDDFINTTTPDAPTFQAGLALYNERQRADTHCASVIEALNTEHQSAFGTQLSVDALLKLAREEMQKVFPDQPNATFKTITKDNFFDKGKSHQAEFAEAVKNQILLPPIAKKLSLEWLEKYIARIDGYKETSEGYQTGFFFFCVPILAESRGLNREATQLLAIYLRDKIINGEDISDDMRNLRQVRERLMQKKYGNEVSLRDINSTEFNDAVKELKTIYR